MASDLASAADRMAPGAPGSSPPAIAFTSTAATTLVRPAGGAAKYISIKATAGVHLAFGGASVAAATNADPLFESTDGWQDMILAPDQTHVSAKGDSAGGSLYIWFSGR